MSTEARQALAELVAVDDLKRSYAQACRHAANFDSAENYQVIDALATEIGKRQPLAWAAARAALSATAPTAGAVPEDVLKAAREFVNNGYRGPLAYARKVFDWVASLHGEAT